LKGLDSSVLLRYILDDDPVWSARAVRFIDAQCSSADPGYINMIVLAETVWSLRRQRGYDDKRVARIIEELLQADSFHIEEERLVEDSLRNFKQGKAGFVDCLIAALNEKASAAPTFSIDKDAIKSGVFTSILEAKPA
jgi:predicted nucleic-acid-binding protein